MSFGTWDLHYDLWDHLPEMAGELDHVAATLIDDLDKRGLLKSTIVVIGTEFGRRPDINQTAGRDHHPAAYSCVVAGGPIKVGQVYGATDSKAFYVDTDGVTLLATHAGDCTVTVTQSGDDYYNSSTSDSVTVTFSKKDDTAVCADAGCAAITPTTAPITASIRAARQPARLARAPRPITTVGRC